MSSIIKNGSKGHHKFTLNVDETNVDTINNRSIISYSFILSPIQSGWDWADWGDKINYSINIDGNVFTGNIPQYDGRSTLTLKSGTINIPHNDNGIKIVDFSFNVTDSTNQSYTCGSASTSGIMQLTEISREAKIKTANDFNDEEKPYMTFENKGGLSMNVRLEFAGTNIQRDNIPNTGNYTFNLTTNERNLLRTKCETNSMTVKYVIATKINGVEKFWSVINKTMTIVNGNPTFNDFEYKDNNTIVSNITGNNQILVKGLSTLQAIITSTNKMIANKQANSKNYVATIDGINKSIDYSDNELTIDIGVINSTGVKKLEVKAFDSRNNPTAVSKDISIYDYDKPVINATVTRLNNFETETTLKVKGEYSKLTIDNIDKNVITTLQYRYKETNGTWTNWKNLVSTISDGKFTCNDVIVSLDNTKSFDFEVQAIDKLTTTVLPLKLDVGKPIFFISSNLRTILLNGNELLDFDIVDTW